MEDAPNVEALKKSQRVRRSAIPRDYEVYVREEIHNRAKIVGCNWVYIAKCDSEGNVERNVARLVEKGCKGNAHIIQKSITCSSGQHILN